MKSKATLAAVIVLILTALYAAAFVYAEDDVIYYDTREEAAAGLREAMKARQSDISIGIYEDVDEDSIKTIIGEVLELALEHTGVPDEGDYIKYQYSDYEGRAETLRHKLRSAVIISYAINYYTTAAEERKVDAKVEDIMASLELDGKTDQQKIRIIHDYICGNTKYDESGAGDEKAGPEHTAYGALINGRAVCQGYSLALYRLLQEAGIENRIVFGKGVSRGISESHSWNIVSVGGVYFYVDATWDDASMSYDYFLRNRNDFEIDHIIDDEYGEEFLTAENPVSISGAAIDYEAPLNALVEINRRFEKAAASALEATESA